MPLLKQTFYNWEGRFVIARDHVKQYVIVSISAGHVF